MNTYRVSSGEWMWSDFYLQIHRAAEQFVILFLLLACLPFYFGQFNTAITIITAMTCVCVCTCACVHGVWNLNVWKWMAFVGVAYVHGVNVASPSNSKEESGETRMQSHAVCVSIKHTIHTIMSKSHSNNLTCCDFQYNILWSLLLHGKQIAYICIRCSNACANVCVDVECVRVMLKILMYSKLRAFKIKKTKPFGFISIHSKSSYVWHFPHQKLVTRLFWCTSSCLHSYNWMWCAVVDGAI